MVTLSLHHPLLPFAAYVRGGTGPLYDIVGMRSASGYRGAVFTAQGPCKSPSLPKYSFVLEHRLCCPGACTKLTLFDIAQQVRGVREFTAPSDTGQYEHLETSQTQGGQPLSFSDDLLRCDWKGLAESADEDDVWSNCSSTVLSGLEASWDCCTQYRSLQGPVSQRDKSC